MLKFDRRVNSFQRDLGWISTRSMVVSQILLLDIYRDEKNKEGQ
jgi:hypothetical protein